MSRRSVGAAAIVIGATFIGLVVWVLGLKGASNMAESLCAEDLYRRQGYGSYRMSGELWLPSFECRLAGTGLAPVVVQHRLYAIAWFGWLVVVPVLFAIATLSLTVHWTRRPR